MFLFRAQRNEVRPAGGASALQYITVGTSDRNEGRGQAFGMLDSQECAWEIPACLITRRGTAGYTLNFDTSCCNSAARVDIFLPASAI